MILEYYTTRALDDEMTNAELAILSLVVERPRHGYEIDQVIEERGMRDWTEVGFSSIYYLLRKLETGGLIEAALEKAERGPARKVYRATPAGKEALRRGVWEALSIPRRCYPPLQLGLANLPCISPDEARAALQQYHDALSERRLYVEQRRRSQQDLPYFVDAMFDHSINMIGAELCWLERFMERMGRQDAQD
jgi:DNA-binding PadR family transcriptional regulator